MAKTPNKRELLSEVEECNKNINILKEYIIKEYDSIGKWKESHIELQKSHVRLQELHSKSLDDYSELMNYYIDLRSKFNMLAYYVIMVSVVGGLVLSFPNI